MALTGSQRYAYSYYVQQGYSPAQAAGMVARLSMESGGTLNPMARGDGGQAFGLAQWHPDRWARVSQWAQSQGLDPNSREAQLRAVPWEMQNHETRAWQALQAARDPRQAYDAMMHYERPAGYTPQNPSGGMGYAPGVDLANMLAGVSPVANPVDNGPEYRADDVSGTQTAPLAQPAQTTQQVAQTKPTGFLSPDAMGQMGLLLLAQSRRRG